MNQDKFSEQVEARRLRLDEIENKCSSDLPSPENPALLEETIEELRSTIEELNVAREELREQNQELEDTRESIYKERQRYQEIFDFAPNGYLVTDGNGKIRDANFAASALFNVSKPNLIGKPIITLIEMSERQWFRSSLLELRRSSNIHQWTFRIKPHQKSPFEATFTVAADPRFTEEEKDYLWIIQDISKQKQAERALRASEAKFRALAESTSAAIFIVQDEKIRYANPAATEITAYTEEELDGMEWVEIVHPSHRQSFLSVDWLTGEEREKGPVAKGSPGKSRQELELLSKNGEECWVDLSLGRMDFAGTPAFLITAYDISQRVKAERDRRELVRQLVSVQEEERRRISRELHDQMGQGLTALSLGLKTIETMQPEDSPARDIINRVQRIADEIGQEIHRLAFELRPASLDDLGLPASLLNYLEELEERMDIQVDYQAVGFENIHPPPQVSITIFRVFQEALTNVVKHARASRVSVVLDCRENGILGVVEDDGCGFDFQKVLSTHGKYRLGIMGMRERAELSGGVVNIETEIGKGTTVFVWIPFKADEEGAVSE